MNDTQNTTPGEKDYLARRSVAMDDVNSLIDLFEMAGRRDGLTVELLEADKLLRTPQAQDMLKQSPPELWLTLVVRQLHACCVDKQ